MFRLISNLRISTVKTGVRKTYSTSPDNQTFSPYVVYWGMGMLTGFFTYTAVYFRYYHEPTIYKLKEDDFHPFKLVESIPLTSSTSLLRFEAYVPQIADGTLPIPSHIVIKDDSCQIAREYSPITFNKNGFDIVVKKYENGSISKLLHSLEPGEAVMARGPIWSFPYSSGGTGITPLYQLIKKILSDPLEKTRIKLIFANRNESEIFLRNELSVLQKAHPDRLDITFAVDKATREWDGQVGLIDKTMVQKFMPDPKGNRSLVLVCGPDGYVKSNSRMVKSLAGEKQADGKQGQLTGILKNAGFTEKNVFKF